MEAGKALTVLAGLACYSLALVGFHLKAPGELTVGLSNIGSMILGSLFVGAGQADKDSAKSIATAAADRVVKSVFPPPPPPG